MPIKTVILLFFYFYSNVSKAQDGIKGIIKDGKNEPIGFVTIYTKELKKSTNSNLDGTFELQLPKGTHTVFFQSMGYKIQQYSVDVVAGFSKLTVTLSEQAYQLKEVNISNGQTNPAVWIMRKAIAAAPYYRRQVLMYNAKVYVKGSGKLDNIPFVFEKLLKKEGFVEGKFFLTESINEVQFSQPNSFKEKALSIKSTMPSNGAPSPMRMARGSMYNTGNAELISPLSPQAFSVYNFTLEGSFYEDGREVNKIKVTPKRKGKDVLDGSIYIMEGLWCLHSTDLTNRDGDFNARIITTFRPLNEFNYVWMPVTYEIKVSGGMLGFKGSFAYLASVSDYKIRLNPNLNHTWVRQQTKDFQQIPIIMEDAPKPQVVKEVKSKRQQEIEILLAKEKLTNMEMLKLANKMKREAEADALKSPQIATDSSEIIIDSLAFLRDSIFWISNRSVALMEGEISSYKQIDSMGTIAKKDSSAKKSNQKFDFKNILLGGEFKFKQSRHWLKWDGLVKNVFVNTVDGWSNTLQWQLGNVNKQGKEWTLTHNLHIPFERKVLNTFVDFQYWYLPQRVGKIGIEFGSNINDFNINGGASAFINSVMLLLDSRNLVKYYQHDYVMLKHQVELANGLLFKTNLNIANRYQLSNINRYALKENTGSNITSNLPIPFYAMPTHQAMQLINSFSFTPYQRYRLLKGRKENIEGKWPTIEIQSVNGIPNILSSDIDYMRLQVGISERIQPLHWLTINATINHQFFVYNTASFFPDINHQNGNGSPVIVSNPLTTFRHLDYYAQSTTTPITTVHAEVKMKRILIKRLPLLNMTDMKEVVFYNSLIKHSNSNNYHEIGYGLAEIVSALRADIFVGLNGIAYQNWGVRLSFYLKQNK